MKTTETSRSITIVMPVGAVAHTDDRGVVRINMDAIPMSQRLIEEVFDMFGARTADRVLDQIATMSAMQSIEQANS